MGHVYTAAKNCQIWLGTVEDIQYWPDEKIVSAFLQRRPFVVL